MNKTIAAIVISIATATSTATLAQGRGGDSAQRIAQRVEQLDSQLNLNAAQETQIRSILQAQQSQGKGSRGVTHERISAVLTEQQKTQFNQMLADRGQGKGRGGGRRTGGRQSY